MKVHWTQRVEASLYPGEAPLMEPPSNVVIELEDGGEVEALYCDETTGVYEVPAAA